MKLTTALLTIITIFSTSINHIWAAETPTSETDPRRREYNTIVNFLLQEFKESRSYSEKALEAKFRTDYYRQQCKMMNALEDLIKFTEANKDLDTLSTKKVAEKLLKKELDLIGQVGVTKEQICEAGLEKISNT